jgi:predicted nuclease of predicted toxin-antitoxin system
MRFLLDENADLRLRPVLLELGHDVTAIAVDYQASISDRDVLDLAYAEGRILITNDRDFGELVFRQHLPHAGIIHFRLATTRFAVKRDRLLHVLITYADQLDRYLVVTERGVRLR